MITFSKEYLDDILDRIAHHSSAIEGNTISLADTISIILYETIPGKANKREFYEVENHKGAFEFLLECLADNREIDIHIICSLHQKLTDRLQYDSGQFKKHENAILGADFETASPQQVPTLMFQWAKNLNYRLNLEGGEIEKIEAIVEAYIQFEKIHPFSDGNGRTGRILMLYSFLKMGMPPLIIDKKNKADYIRYLSEENLKGFTHLAYEIIEMERSRSIRFGNKCIAQMEE
ncbi:MAG: Fic family protein [Turicibacter sp.]|nr:Fic family protein [Turicibacter sp.]